MAQLTHHTPWDSKEESDGATNRDAAMEAAVAAGSVPATTAQASNAPSVPSPAAPVALQRARGARLLGITFRPFHGFLHVPHSPSTPRTPQGSAAAHAFFDGQLPGVETDVPSVDAVSPPSRGTMKEPPERVRAPSFGRIAMRRDRGSGRRKGEDKASVAKELRLPLEAFELESATPLGMEKLDLRAALAATHSSRISGQALRRDESEDTFPDAMSDTSSSLDPSGSTASTPRPDDDEQERESSKGAWHMRI